MILWACRSKERYDEIEGKLTPFLRGCGYNPKKDLLYIPISGLMGTNMKQKVSADVCSWYNVSLL
jgi:peptide chain release factor subunit 3